MLGLDPLVVAGPPWVVELKGRAPAQLATALQALEVLTAELTCAGERFHRSEVLALGATDADLELISAAGIGVWVESAARDPDSLRAAAALVAAPIDAPLPGVAQAVGALALRNNRFLRPYEPRGRSFLVL